MPGTAERRLEGNYETLIGRALREKRALLKLPDDEDSGQLISLLHNIYGLLASARKLGLIPTADSPGLPASLAHDLMVPLNAFGNLIREIGTIGLSGSWAEDIKEQMKAIEPYAADFITALKSSVLSGLCAEESDKKAREVLQPNEQAIVDAIDCEKGKRLIYAVELCAECFEGAGETEDPLVSMIYELARRFTQEILDELSRHRVLGICAYSKCGRPFFPAHPQKNYCSQEYEGRACGRNARSNRHYHK